MAIAVSDLQQGTVIRFLRGHHPGSILEVRRVKATKVEMRQPHGQHGKNTAQTNSNKFDVPIDWILANAEIVSQPRHTAADKIAATPKEFRAMWADPHLSIAEVAILSETTEAVVKRVAKEMGLSKKKPGATETVNTRR